MSLGLVVDVDSAVGLVLLHHPLRSLRRLTDAGPEQRSVLGVAGLVQLLVRSIPDLPVVYLTAAPAPLRPAVRRVLRVDGYPPGKIVGRRGTGLLRGVVRHKRVALEGVLSRDPGRRWVLVGDDGGPDPALFAYAAARGRAAAVAVRHLGGEDPGLLARMEERAGDVPVVCARTGESLAPLLVDALGLEPQGVADWFLTRGERGNDGTDLRPWTEGNAALPLVHGADYLTALGQAVAGAGEGDTVLLGGWRADAGQQLQDGTSAGDALAAAASRGALVRGLVWRSHSRLLGYSWRENAGFADRVARGGGRVLLDHRVVSFGSHHQKLAVVRHRDQPADDVAFVGGIDIAASRRDDARHQGDAFTRPFAEVYGDQAPWHDVQVELRGPAVRDVEEGFRERWADPSPLVRAPWRVLNDILRGQPRQADPLPPARPDPPAAGRAAVQLLRTYPWRGQHLPFAPRGERSVARGYAKALSRARRLVYVEDQYLWSSEVAAVFAAALRQAPELRLIAVVPAFPDQESPEVPAALLGQYAAMDLVLRAGGDRVQVLTLENEEGTPVYTHAKLCVVDDVWAAVGSANLNRRSWTHDSELVAAVLDEERDGREPVDPAGLGDGARRFARELRLTLLREHLGRGPGEDADLLDPDDAARTVRSAAEALDTWHDRGQEGPRPAGRLRRHDPLPSPPDWAQPLVGAFYRAGFDPDGRPLGMRLRRTF